MQRRTYDRYAVRIVPVVTISSTLIHPSSRARPASSVNVPQRSWFRTSAWVTLTCPSGAVSVGRGADGNLRLLLTGKGAWLEGGKWASRAWRRDSSASSLDSVECLVGVDWAVIGNVSLCMRSMLVSAVWLILLERSASTLVLRVRPVDRLPASEHSVPRTRHLNPSD